jgi:CRISPR-associated endonuclease/helicase Cas3
MSTEPLLAKSVRLGEPVPAGATLQGHTAFVVAAARALLDQRGAASLSAAGLSATLLDRLRRIALVGAFAHDLGKCSDHFQAMVRWKRKAPQLVRHEAATLWLAWPGRPLGDYLESATGTREDLVLALCAAAGHHRKFWSRAIAPDDAGAGTSITLLASHDDFVRLVRAAPAMTRLTFTEPPALANLSIEVTRRFDPRSNLEAWEDEARAVARTNSVLLALAKAMVLDADVAGSALSKSGDRPVLIGELLSHRADRERIHEVVSARLRGGELRPFQFAVASSDAKVTMVRAGCGTGKTVAAYEWAARQHAGRQLWVTYPTTGTATEGFRDYAHNPELDVDLAARLEHGRAEVDVEIFGLRDDDEGQRDRDRLDAIRAWGEEVVVCTVDTVLGLVQNQRKGLYAWAGLAHSAIVFDEIHAYDDALFGALLRFLEALPGIPTLLMTASLPTARLKVLRDLVARVHGCPLAEIDGPADLERMPRYARGENGDPWTSVARVIGEGGKVLWVSNTVNRALEFAGTASQRGFTPLIYHSRFRYRDRVARHGAIIDAFVNPGAALAVTTQVAEMSLDLSADLLVTDLAPIPALIQRLGRLNRRARPDTPCAPKPFLVLEPDTVLPYDSTGLSEARLWLASLGAGPLSQRELVDAWTTSDATEPPAIPSRWLDGGFNTEIAPLREGDIGITVLLPDDAAEVRMGARSAVEVALPMGPPRRHDWVTWPRERGYVVPPAGAIAYDALRGARWQ